MCERKPPQRPRSNPDPRLSPVTFDRQLVQAVRVGDELVEPACDNKNLDGPERYFADHKVGDSPDFGVFKHGTDHVISVHGFFDADMSVCLKIV
jgi:hypothetical protein